ncbi:DUF3427 domain-containing protein [Alkalicoccobacillus gibsonii]|uniref:DUF3427 domain-containing protein n=1 Tax=Alkalicoccobacillus gibsonii TaxID=79881 RepID=A0ABU9VEJ9_9BACI
MVKKPLLEINSNKKFIKNKQYSRKDIFSILNLPEQSGGNWMTGFNSYNNEFYIFANINSAGRTGHDYDNRFIGDELQWYGKRNYSIDTPTIKSIINPNRVIHVFTRENSKDVYFIYQGMGRVKEYFDSKPVRFLLEFGDENQKGINNIPEEVSEISNYPEGTVKQITINIYERNLNARKKCIEFYGLNCAICSFNFQETYGILGKDYIHVHHIKELHTIGGGYEVDPIKDLRPVCPNCHAMLHKRKPAYSIEELKTLIG